MANCWNKMALVTQVLKGSHSWNRALLYRNPVPMQSTRPRQSVRELHSVSPIKGHQSEQVEFIKTRYGTELEQIRQMMMESDRLLVLTGAGISTESGIPDYRSPGRGEYRPLQHWEFMRDSWTRRRYWARSSIGYRRLSSAVPNYIHESLAAWEGDGLIHHVITQNVDRLHQRAGNRDVLELHGTVHEVECLDCGYTESRAETQTRIEEYNKEWLLSYQAATSHRPDGDVEIPDDAYHSFSLPFCLHCGSEMLKPMVVFHGGSVPKKVTERATELVEEADGMLVLGSSLTVWSAFRLARAVSQECKPLAIINYGHTRADSLAPSPIKVEGSCSAALSYLNEGSPSVSIDIRKARASGQD
eukprot:gb/GECG01003046.1/.p1 GENE.gb/GECG01003046.1/~~gb/GECG01003046.1/.p1  ORF type:complete len:359 (+),score=24.26 gb/GECG01003046.1/:1-1077(+)